MKHANFYLVVIASLMLLGMINRQRHDHTHHPRPADVCEQSDCKPLTSQAAGKNRSFEYD